MSNKEPKIPEGYRENANGDLVLIQNIKEIVDMEEQLAAAGRLEALVQ